MPYAFCFAAAMARQLRSLHLSPTLKTSTLPHALFGGTNPNAHFRFFSRFNFFKGDSNRGRESSICQPEYAANFPRHYSGMDGTTTVIIGVILSLIFIASISCAFAGANDDEPFFKSMLNGVAKTSPGIVLLGENVDIDIDERSLTISWSIHACGEGHVLAGSPGSYGSDLCGLPAIPLQIYVDGTDTAALTYDPAQIPYDRNTGIRRRIHALVQFDIDYILDAHTDRLYPFDTYALTTTLRASTSANVSVPIQRLATIEEIASFSVSPSDFPSYTSSDETELASRDIMLRLTRPGGARAFTMLLFAVAWMLTHIAVVNVCTSWKHTETKPILKHLVAAFAILIGLPAVRNSMPDDPDLDGILIDCIGYFPQMVITGSAVIIILVLLLSREFDLMDHVGAISTSPPVPRKIPPIPSARSTSLDVAAYEIARLLRHAKGEYVFPPVSAKRRSIQRVESSTTAPSDTAASSDST